MSKSCELCLEIGFQREAIGQYATELGTFWLCDEHRALAQGDVVHTNVDVPPRGYEFIAPR